MKKIVIASLLGTMFLSLAACGGNADVSSENVIDRAAESISSEVSTSETVSESETTSQESQTNDANEAAPDFSSVYTEPMSGRCTIDIESAGDNKYNISIHWGSSAFESANWEMTATYYDSTTLLEYTDAKYFIRTYASEDDYTDNVVYTDGAGEFWFTEDGMLGWRSAKMDVDYITGDTFFENIE